jgi:hypothetical protein
MFLVEVVLMGLRKQTRQFLPTISFHDRPRLRVLSHHFLGGILLFPVVVDGFRDFGGPPPVPGKFQHYGRYKGLYAVELPVAQWFEQAGSHEGAS